MQLFTVENIPGKNLELIGLVQGSTVQSKHIGKEIMAGFKNLVGGELNSYTELLDEAREEARQRMIYEAEELGADAVIGVRYAQLRVTDGAAEILIYGTAVKFV